MRLSLDILGQTLHTLWAHKLRSFLTMFGIAWGVGSLLLLVGLGEGFRSGNRKQFDELGEDVMFIWGGRAPAMDGSFNSLQQYYLTDRDYRDIATECPDVRAVTPDIRRNDIRAVSDFYQSRRSIWAFSEFPQIRYVPLANGRWLNESGRFAEAAMWWCSGTKRAASCLAGRPALGSTILLGDIRYQVIGVVKRVGHGRNNDQESAEFRPFSTMRQNFPPFNVGEVQERVISFINYQPRSRALHEAANLRSTKLSPATMALTTPTWTRTTNGTRLGTADPVGKIFDAMNVFLGAWAWLRWLWERSA